MKDRNENIWRIAYLLVICFTAYLCVREVSRSIMACAAIDKGITNVIKK